ncbi:hypothetical protein [Alkalihalobacterium bogoriense]|uniref:hypothetical protein n=1 Tax=Alkalihalobacterium bogoriense TaxID=246272 RepID=UPI000479E6A8|nr:hypothetical protein [Alkalihalobacterium bogoriense]
MGKRSFFILIIFALLVSGCGGDLQSSAVESNIESMPNDVPQDFNFSVKFGVNKGNEINTFEDTVTKDLIENGSATINLTLTAEEMEIIYQKMKDINILSPKQLTPETNCAVEPHEDDEWNISMNGQTITHFISGAYCEPTNDVTQFIELRNDVYRIVKSKDEYKELPPSEGAYE